MENPRKIMLVVIVTILVLFGIFGAYEFGKRSSYVPDFPYPTDHPTQEVTETPTFPSNTSFTTTNFPSGKSSPTLNIRNIILTTDPELDGYRLSNNTGNDSKEIRVGRNATAVSRGFINFDISKLPGAVNILEAKLRLYQAQVIGNPYQAGNILKIDHLTYGDSLDSVDYGIPALVANFATLSTNKNIEWKEVDALEMLRDDIANTRSRSQFRVHFQTEVTGGTNDGDFAYFESGDNSLKTTYIPQLVIKYY